MANQKWHKLCLQCTKDSKFMSTSTCNSLFLLNCQNSSWYKNYQLHVDNYDRTLLHEDDLV